MDKAGATALFVGEGNKNNNIGIVVNPVRLSSLRDFGTPEFVADKLIQAERRKVHLLILFLSFLSFFIVYTCFDLRQLTNKIKAYELSHFAILSATRK